MKPKFKVGDILRYKSNLGYTGNQLNLITAVTSDEYYYNVMTLSGKFISKSNIYHSEQERSMELDSYYIIKQQFNKDLDALLK